jgi:hypothetical protein
MRVFLSTTTLRKVRFGPSPFGLEASGLVTFIGSIFVLYCA